VLPVDPVTGAPPVDPVTGAPIGRPFDVVDANAKMGYLLGDYDSKQLAELAMVNIDGLKEFGYFTYIVLGDMAVKLGEPQKYWLEYKNGVLSLIFTLPFAQPIAPSRSKDLTILVLDPTYFIAFEFAKANPVRLAQGAPKSCKVTIAELAEGSAEARRLSKVFDELGPGLGYTQISSISC
jgi:ABC-type uncharacterized transport system substrate-binding protein